jgi:hypothetical protein
MSLTWMTELQMFSVLAFCHATNINKIILFGSKALVSTPQCLEELLSSFALDLLLM